MNKVRSIIILEDSSKSYFGGGQAITLQICNMFSSVYRLILFDTKKKTPFNDRIKNFIDKREVLVTTGRIRKGARVDFSFLWESISFPFFLLLNSYRVSQCISLERSLGNKVLLYATTRKTLILAFLVGKFNNSNYVFHAHSVVYLKPGFFHFSNRFYESSKAIVAVSNFVKSGLSFPNVSVIHNCVSIPDVQPVKSILDKEKFVVASFSSLIPQKGLEYLMESYNYLSPKLQHKLEIRIYGKGFYKNELSKLENEHVKLMGFTEHPEILLKDEIDIIVVPSVILESFGMGVIEAFKFGVPVICTNQAGPAEIVTNGMNGFLVPPKDPKSIAVKIEELLVSTDRYADYSKSAIEATRHYGADIFQMKFGKLLHDSFD